MGEAGHVLRRHAPLNVRRECWGGLVLLRSQERASQDWVIYSAPFFELRSMG